MKKITNNTEHKKALSEVFQLMNKGSENLTQAEEKKIRQISLQIQEYEANKYPIEMPKTLLGMIELRMYEFRLNQLQLAKKLKVSPAKLSLILNGKQKPDLDFLKVVRKELNIDADFILDHAC